MFKHHSVRYWNNWNLRISILKSLEHFSEFTIVSSSDVIWSIELRAIIFRLLKSSISRWVRCDSPIVVAMMAPMMIQSVSEDLMGSFWVLLAKKYHKFCVFEFSTSSLELRHTLKVNYAESRLYSQRRSGESYTLL